MPLYNSEKFLIKTLDSIANQTLKDFELIVINDASTDLSLKIAKEYSQKFNFIKIINLSENKGVSYARNLGLSYSQGEYICFVDSDDIIAENFLEIMYKTSQKYNSDIVCCNYYYINEKKYKRKNFLKMKEGNYPSKALIPILLKDTFIHFFVWNKMFKREIVQNNSVIFINKCFEDMIFTLKLFYFSDKITIINNYLYYYRKHNSSLSNFMSLKKIHQYISSLKIIKTFLLDNNIYNIYKFSYIFLSLRFLASCTYRIPCIYLNSRQNINMRHCINRTFLSIIQLVTDNTTF